MGDIALARLRRKLESAELEHLRRHSSDLAIRLENMEERARHAEDQAEFYWEQHTNLIRSLSEQGEEIGMTINGHVGVINKENAFAMPELAAGESYVSTLFDAATQSGYHLILLPGDNDPAEWQEQLEWAQSIGGELPNRVEQSMLHSKCKLLFNDAWYWSSEEHEDPDYALIQSFRSGSQSLSLKRSDFRARAVRRLELQ